MRSIRNHFNACRRPGGLAHRQVLFLLIAAAILCTLKIVAASEPDNLLHFDTLYKSAGVLGMQFSDKVLSHSGKPVVIRGFMAPPLKAEASFFVLTRQPVALCPFCDSDADWPMDIVVVYLGRDQDFVQNNTPIEVKGILEVGSFRDPKTGFLSLLRIVKAGFKKI